MFFKATGRSRSQLGPLKEWHWSLKRTLHQFIKYLCDPHDDVCNETTGRSKHVSPNCLDLPFLHILALATGWAYWSLSPYSHRGDVPTLWGPKISGSI
jgi:hypothetical protein